MLHNVLNSDWIDIVAFYIRFGFSYMFKENCLVLLLIFSRETVGLCNVGKDGVHEGLYGKIITEAHRFQMFCKCPDGFIYGILWMQLMNRRLPGKAQLLREGICTVTGKGQPGKMQGIFRRGVIAGKL